MEEYEIKHSSIIRALSPECMVLLKSDGSFPLEFPGKIALYGNAARNTIKGGTGSGDVNVRHFPSVEEGLENSGFTVTTKEWLDGYDAIRAQASRDFREKLKARIAAEGIGAIMLALGAIMPEPEYELPLNGEGDTAVYVLGRISGEGTDRQSEKGDFELTDTEIRDIRQLQSRYEKFMLVLNVGGAVDLSPIADEVGNILLLSQLGSATGDAFADVLLGRSYPSGKLASTWARWEDYCHVGDFGQSDDTRYKEGIFVGYRYFDSVDTAPLFPFGFGLGYTDFTISAEEASVDGSTVSVTAKVTNIGFRPGKEIVQLYVSVPEGKLTQPYQTLAAFAKTGELQPGECGELTLSFHMEELASFDEASCCAILEAGRYILHLGSSSRDTAACAAIELDEAVTVQRLHDVGGKPDFADWKPDIKRKSAIPDEITVLKMSASSVKEIIPSPHETDPAARELAASMTANDLALICTGAFNGAAGSNSVIGSAGITVAGSAGETTGIFSSEGIPALIMADGPAGVRISPRYGVDENGAYSLDNGNLSAVTELLPEPMRALLGVGKAPQKRSGTAHEQYCTAIPIGTALAQSWSTEVCEKCGELVASEMERFGVHIWLAPALNIHRLPLCGRNFEYYSEDPLISGKMAAAITRSVQKHPDCFVSVKHFCCNNQETNRMHSNSMVSQRALRDIYLRGFRIAIDESDPATVMSSYNLLNGEHTSQRRDLLETLLRQEWSYKGIVMSDWLVSSFTKPGDKYPAASASGSVSAGNDILMPGSEQFCMELVRALDEPSGSSPLTREELERSAARMIELAQKTHRRS